MLKELFGLTVNAINTAMDIIDTIGVRPSRESKKYEVLRDGKAYSPKAVVEVANKIVNPDSSMSWKDFSGGESTNKILRNLGFEVTKK